MNQEQCEENTKKQIAKIDQRIGAMETFLEFGRVFWVHPKNGMFETFDPDWSPNTTYIASTFNPKDNVDDKKREETLSLIKELQEKKIPMVAFLNGEEIESDGGIGKYSYCVFPGWLSGACYRITKSFDHRDSLSQKLSILGEEPKWQYEKGNQGLEWCICSQNGNNILSSDIHDYDVPHLEAEDYILDLIKASPNLYNACIKAMKEIDDHLYKTGINESLIETAKVLQKAVNLAKGL